MMSRWNAWPYVSKDNTPEEAGHGRKLTYMEQGVSEMALDWELGRQWGLDEMAWLG